MAVAAIQISAGLDRTEQEFTNPKRGVGEKDRTFIARAILMLGKLVAIGGGFGGSRPDSGDFKAPH